MTLPEFSDQFDVLYNNITSNQAPGLNEYEKSVFLTKAQNEIVKNYFSANSKGNTLGQGFDDSAKRQADFSSLMKTVSCEQVVPIDSVDFTLYTFQCTEDNSTRTIVKKGTQDLIYYIDNNVITPFEASENTYTISDGKYSDNIVRGFPYSNGTLYVTEEDISLDNGKINRNSHLYVLPNDVFIPINESICTRALRDLQVVPLRYDEYMCKMAKPFKYPPKYQAWRLLNSGYGSLKFAEIITNTWDTVANYVIRYVRKPRPIILNNLGTLTIDGFNGPCDCELDEMMHEDILQRAVELAKVAWTAQGNENTQLVMQAGQRSE